MFTGTGSIASHLAWDMKKTKDVFDRLTLASDTVSGDFVSRFVMTEGGLILYKPNR